MDAIRLLRGCATAAALALLAGRARAQDPVGSWQQRDGRRVTIAAVPGQGLTLTTPNGVPLRGELVGRKLTLRFAYRSGAAGMPAFLTELPEPVRAQLEREGKGFAYEGTINAAGDSIDGSFLFPRHDAREVVGWLPRPAALTRVFRATRVVQLESPDRLGRTPRAPRRIELCDGAGSTVEPPPLLGLRVRRAGLPDTTIWPDEPRPCVRYSIAPDPEEGFYVLRDADGRAVARLPEGRYVVRAEVVAADPSIQYVLPGPRRLALDPVVRIELRDRRTGAVIVSRDRQSELGRAVAGDQILVRVTGSSDLRLALPLAARSSVATLTQGIPRLESSGPGLTVFEHQGDLVVPVVGRATALSSTQLAIAPRGDVVTFAVPGREVRVRVSMTGEWKVVELLEQQLRDHRELYEALLANPALDARSRGELEAKLGLATRVLALHERGRVEGGPSAFMLAQASRRYFELLRMTRAQLGAYDPEARVGPSLLPPGLRDRPVPAPFAREGELIAVAKRDADRQMTLGVVTAQLDAIGAFLQLPVAVLDAPRQLTEQLWTLYSGRNLAGDWASTDDRLFAALDLGSMAVGPLLRGVQLLRPARAAGRTLLDTDGFRVVQRAQDALAVPDLSAMQAQRLLQAHAIGRPPYSWSDLRRKMDIATRPPPQGAGLTREQADLLLRQGVLGLAPVDPASSLAAASRRRYRQLTTRETTTLSRAELEELRGLREQTGDLTDPETGSPDHKAERWHAYRSDPDSEGWSFERWSPQYDRNMDNWRRGRQDQDDALAAVRVTNNDAAGQRVTFSDGADQTRPDGMTDGAVIDCKSLSVRGAESERVLSLDAQLRLQREAARGKLTCTPPGCVASRKRELVVIMLSEDAGKVRPSRLLADPGHGADVIYHRNTTTGSWSVWDRRRGAAGDWVPTLKEAVAARVAGR